MERTTEKVGVAHRIDLENEICSPDTEDSKHFEIAGNWIFTPGEQTIERIGGDTSTIRTKTCNVLMLLIQKQGKVVTTNEFFEEVWEQRFVGENVLKRSVFELRSIFEDKERKVIVTVPKKGYRFVAPVIPIAIDSYPYNIDSYPCNIGRQSEASKSNQGVEQEMVIAVPLNEEKAEKKPRLKNAGFWSASALLIASLCWLVLDQNRTLLKQVEQNRRLEEESVLVNQFVADLLSNYKLSTNKAQDEIKTALNASKTNILQQNIKESSRLRLLKILAETYLKSGFYMEAKRLIEESVRKSEVIWGADAVETLEIRHSLIEVLIELGERDAAYSTAKYVLNIARNTDAVDKKTMSHSYFWMAKAQQSCVYPFCDRSNIFEAGKQNSERALDLFEKLYGIGSRETADALSLLSHFTHDPEKKITLCQRALKIYKTNYGKFNEKAAGAYVQIGRTFAAWKKDFASGEIYLKEALDILEKIGPKDHYVIGEIYQYLGELYLLSGRLNESGRYLTKAGEIIRKVRAKTHDDNLQNLILLAKANLYQGRQANSIETVNELLEVTGWDKLTFPYSIIQEIKALEIRTKWRKLAQDIQLKELLEAIEVNRELGKKAGNTFATILVEHEYLTLLLRRKPEIFDEEAYLETLRIFTDSYTRYNLAFGLSDLKFVWERAFSLCREKNDLLCDKITAIAKPHYQPSA